MSVMRVAECAVCHDEFRYEQVSDVRERCDACRLARRYRPAGEDGPAASIEIVPLGSLGPHRPEATWAYQFRCADGDVIPVRWRRWESPLEVATFLAYLFPNQTPTVVLPEGA